MPIYEFLCKSCGLRFETIVRIGCEKNVVCVSCTSPDIQKLVSSFGIGGGASRIKSSSTSCATCSSKTCSTCA